MDVATRAELIENAQGMVVLYLKAERAVLTGQAYTIAGQSLTRADLDKIRAGRKEWEDKLEGYLRGGPRQMLRVIPVDD